MVLSSQSYHPHHHHHQTHPSLSFAPFDHSSYADGAMSMGGSTHHNTATAAGTMEYGGPAMMNTTGGGSHPTLGVGANTVTTTTNPAHWFHPQHYMSMPAGPQDMKPFVSAATAAHGGGMPAVVPFHPPAAGYDASSSSSSSSAGARTGTGTAASASSQPHSPIDGAPLLDGSHATSSSAVYMHDVTNRQRFNSAGSNASSSNGGGNGGNGGNGAVAGMQLIYGSGSVGGDALKGSPHGAHFKGGPTHPEWTNANEFNATGNANVSGRFSPLGTSFPVGSPGGGYFNHNHHDAVHAAHHHHHRGGAASGFMTPRANATASVHHMA